jgi:cation:H+ antiporter
LSFAAASLLSLIGLVGLTVGAEWLVRGASRLAAQFGISSLAIGLTVVAYGTSAPEILASLVAAAAGYPEMTVGNVLGSNIANVGLILGATATLAPLAIA